MWFTIWYFCALNELHVIAIYFMHSCHVLHNMKSTFANVVNIALVNIDSGYRLVPSQRHAITSLNSDLFFN